MAFKDIRKSSRRSLTLADIGFLLGVVILLGAILALNLRLARTVEGGEWLYLRWSAIRASTGEALEPYGATVAGRVQTFVYGRAAYLNEYPYALNDPFYLLQFYRPLAWFSEFALARAVWMLLAEAALVASGWLTLRLAGWEGPGGLTALFLSFTVFNYFSVSAVLSGSPVVFMVLFALGVLWALQAQADEVVGLLLALLAYQWEVGALFFLSVLVLVFAHRRWGVLTGFGMLTVALLLMSFLLDANWFIPYARAVLFDWGRGIDLTFATTLSYLFPAFDASLGRWFTLALVGLLLVEALRAVDGQFLHILWLAALALVINPLVGFAIFPANHAAFVPACLLILLLGWERWHTRRALVITLLLACLLGLPYVLFQQIQLSTARVYPDLMKILPPLFLLLGLYWMRWWAVRPPRLWADQIGGRA